MGRMRHIRIIPALLIGLAASALAARAANVTVNPATQYQTILGWGATSSGIDVPQAIREQILDEAVNDLGLTRLRFEIPRREWEDAINDDGDPDNIVWSAFKTSMIDARVLNWVQPFKQRVEANGDPFNLYVSPSFFDGGSSGSVPAWMLNSPGEYAEWATACLLYLKNTYNISANYYSICNEAGNGNAFTAAVVGKMIKTLGPKLPALGLPTKIEFPECMHADQSWSYIQSLQGDADVWPHIGVLTYHLYGPNGSRTSIRDFAAQKGLPTGQTEFMGTTINDLYDDLTLGGVSYWEHYVLAFYGNVTSTGDYFGANYNMASFSRYSQYWNFRQIMHYVRPGAIRVGAGSNDSGLRPLAFEKNGKVTVVLLNNTDPQQARSATITGLPAGTYGVCRSVAAGVYQELGPRTIDGTVSITVDTPANSVFTIYPHPGGNLPPSVTDWKAAPNYLTLPASAATLSASATDPENDAVSYLWSIESAPPGAAVALATPDAAVCAVSGLTASGEYVFAVNISDPTHAVIHRVTLPVLASNQSPIIEAVHNRLPVTVTLPASATTLRGSARDLEGDPLTYQWSVVSQPPGASAVLANSTTTSCAASGLTQAGDYVFRFEIRDPTHMVSRDMRVKIYPANTAPVISQATASPASFALPQTSTQLSAVTSDPQGDVISHWWSVKSAPAGTKPMIANPGSKSTSVTGLSLMGSYVFTLTVVDRTLVATRDVSVTVTAQPVSVSQALALPDGWGVEISSVIISAVLPDRSYVETADARRGIGMTSHLPLTGRVVKVTGTMTTIDGERMISATNVSFLASAPVPKSRRLSLNSLGGGPCGLQEGVGDWRLVWNKQSKVWERRLFHQGGANNVGLLVKVTGLVSNIGQGCFYLNDGCVFDEGNPSMRGVRVDWPFADAMPADRSYVEIAAISSCRIVTVPQDGDVIVRLLRPISATAFTTLLPTPSP